MSRKPKSSTSKRGVIVETYDVTEAVEAADASPPSAAELAPDEAVAGGMENIPEELLSPDERVEEEIDQAGLEQDASEDDVARTREISSPPIRGD